jgi:HAE1 family hydrophobic/amphiphilic exporter-1
MLLGTLLGVLVVPGLYYVFAKLADGRHMIRDEDEVPLTEDFTHKKRKRKKLKFFLTAKESAALESNSITNNIDEDA